MEKYKYEMDDKWLAGFRQRVLEAFGARSNTELVEILQKNHPNIKYPTISHYLNGNRKVPVSFLFQIYSATGRSIHWLLTAEKLSDEMDAEDLKIEGITEFLADQVGIYTDKRTRSIKAKEPEKAEGSD